MQYEDTESSTGSSYSVAKYFGGKVVKESSLCKLCWHPDVIHGEVLSEGSTTKSKYLFPFTFP